MYKKIYLALIILMTSCSENKNTNVKQDNNNEISCEICLSAVRIPHLKESFHTAEFNPENNLKYEELRKEMNLEEEKLDSLISMYNSENGKINNESLNLAYEKCLNSNPFKLIDSPNNNLLFVKYKIYLDQLDFFENIGNEVELKENGEYRLTNKNGAIYDFNNEEQLNIYLENFNNILLYVKSKLNDLTLQIYNKRHHSLTEIEYALIELRVLKIEDYYFHSKKIIDNDVEYKNLLNKLNSI
ncbi:hypothetical protein N8927_00305 [Crocinitomicaceae bacterium]|nr:hypothetical protein [Crocinitomicaceae bacterium]